MPSGWFPDPHGRHDYRWFNGTAWTADVSDDGRRLVDPYGAAPIGRGRTGPGAGNGFATAAIMCGLVALLFAWMPVFVVIGIVLGDARRWCSVSAAGGGRVRSARAPARR